jgi:hypothetical protein
MKGIIFCEFLEMAEETFGIVVVDEVLETTELPSGGIYTSVGTYDHQELIAMVIRLSQITKTPLPDLLQTYGQNLFGKLMETLPQFIPQNQDCFEFIKAIDSYIHVEVRKLYPDAELPHLRCDEVDDNKLLLHYSSCRPFAKVAEGLLLGCADYFNNAFTLSVADSEQPSDHEISFQLLRTKKSA